MKKKPITNTLLTFFGFRGPQLAVPAVKAPRYVYHPEGLKKGVFYDGVAKRPAGTTKMEALQKALKDFGSPFTSGNDVQKLEPTLYDFSIWVTQNKTTYTNEELQSEAKKVRSRPDDKQAEVLWGNFFYQMVSRNSSYTTEAIVEMHIGDLAYKIWQHDKVLPYIFQQLKSKIEVITPIQAIHLYGSRARTPLHEWEKLEGKDWDILVVCRFPIINTDIWTTSLNYNIDLKVTDPKGAENFFRHQKQTIELFPTNQLKL